MTENTTANPLLVGLVEYLSKLCSSCNCYCILLLGNNCHVSNVKLQERQPANLQLLTSWEVVGVAINYVIIYYNYREITIAYQMTYDNSTSPIMASILTGVLP